MPLHEWTDHTSQTVVATADQVDRLNRDGYFVIDDAFHIDTVDDILLSVSASAGGAAQLDSSQSETLRNVCSHPLLAGLARDFLGPDARVHSDHLSVRLPHQREPHTFRHDDAHGQVSPQQFITCWLALTNATVTNGCLAIARGRHRLGVTGARPASELDPADVTDVEVRAGSVVVMTTLTPRRTHTNTTDRPAMAYVIRYVRDQAIVLSDHDGTAAGSSRRFPVVRGGQLVAPA